MFLPEFQRKGCEMQIIVMVDQFDPRVKEFVGVEIYSITQLLILCGDVATTGCFMGGVRSWAECGSAAMGGKRL